MFMGFSLYFWGILGRYTFITDKRKTAHESQKNRETHTHTDNDIHVKLSETKTNRYITPLKGYTDL